MAFNIKTFSDNVVNILTNANTTTATIDISDGLTDKRVQSIKLGYHVNKSHLNILYPAIWIEPQSRSDQFAQIGNNAKRDMIVPFNIVAIVQTGLGSINGRENSDSEMLQLSSNIETFIRNNIRLSSTSDVLQTLITNVNYDVTEDNDTYNSISIISCESKVLSI